MASSCSISLLASSVPMKIVPYVPPARKPKPKPKAKSMATTNTTVYNSLGVGSPKDEDWLHINDFPTDSNASRSLDPGVPTLSGAADAPSSLDHNMVGGLSTAPKSEKPEHYQSGQESLSRVGTGHATSVAEAGSSLNGLFNGSSLEFPLMLESDAAEEHYSPTQARPSNGWSDYQGNGYHAASTERYRTEQHGDLDAASMRALLGNPEGMCYQRSPEQKRKRLPSADTIIPSVEALDHSFELDLEYPHSAKRSRAAEQLGEILDAVSTPKSTSLPSPKGQVPSSRAGNASPRLSDRDSRGNSAESLDPPQCNIPNLGNGGDSTHICETDEPLHPSRRYSSSKRIEADQEFRLGSERSEDESIGSDGEATRIDPQRTFSSGTKAVYNSSIGRRLSDYVPYEITDIGHCQVPKDSPIVTTIVHCDEIMPALHANSSALKRNLLGNKGELIRTIKLSSGSWLLLGYRLNDHGVPNRYNRSSMQRNTDWESSCRSNAANYNAVHPDTNGSEEDGDEDTSDDGHMHSCKRIIVQWKELDTERLLSYRDKQGMDWDEIFRHFPDRTPGAIRLRYNMLHRKKEGEKEKKRKNRKRRFS